VRDGGGTRHPPPWVAAGLLSRRIRGPAGNPCRAGLITWRWFPRWNPVPEGRLPW